MSAPYNHFKDKEGLLIEIVLLGNRTLEMDLRTAAATAITAEAALIEVFLAYIQFAREHPDLFAVMFQSGINKDKYPEVHASAAAAFGIAGELAAQIERTPAAAQQLTLAIWTMAHGFAALEAERALTQVEGIDAGTSARELVGRLLHAELYPRS